MVTPEILAFVKDNLAKGTSVEDIKKTLASSGWSETDISSAISSAQSGTPLPPPASSTSNDHRTLITILLLLFITPVGLIVMWFWSKWKVWVKILVTLLLVLPVLLFTTLFLIGMGSYFTTSRSTPFKTSFRTSFINSCSESAVNSGMTTSDCTCIADNLIKSLDTAALTRISTQMLKSGETPPELITAITSCMEK